MKADRAKRVGRENIWMGVRQAQGSGHAKGLGEREVIRR